MAGNALLIYGANGYTGSLIVARAAALGLQPIVAGRREAAIRPLAERHGLPFRAFDLADREAAERGLAGAGALLLAAGPFSATSAPAVDACLATRTHYIDISGEVAVFEAVQRRDQEARHAGITLLPGAGFDVVPSDCLALGLHRALPGATQLTLAIAVEGRPGPGTLKTAVEGAAEGGWVRREGRLVNVPAAWRSRQIPFAGGPRWAMTIPWGDLSTAYWSTGIPNIEVYMAAPRAAIAAARLGRSVAALLRRPGLQAVIKRAIDATITGGDAAVRAAGSSQVWGRAEAPGGASVEGLVTTLETTTLTAYTTLDIALRILKGETTPGYTTPGLAFGAGYLQTLPSTRLTLHEVSR
jgi:short subunit dehydrogenase-like uncharacterized protein